MLACGEARIDYDSMDSLSASTGDVIEIRGKRRTVAKCLPLYPSDEGKGIIRVDGLVRNNAGVAIGDTVVVRKIKAVPAEKVIVAPLEAIPSIDERYLADALESVPLIKGDNVMVPYFGGRLSFQVIGVTPVSGRDQTGSDDTVALPQGPAQPGTPEWTQVHGPGHPEWEHPLTPASPGSRVGTAPGTRRRRRARGSRGRWRSIRRTRCRPPRPAAGRPPGALWVSLALAATLLLCGGGAVSAFLLLRDADDPARPTRRPRSTGS